MYPIESFKLSVSRLFLISSGERAFSSLIVGASLTVRNKIAGPRCFEILLSLKRWSRPADSFTRLVSASTSIHSIAADELLSNFLWAGAFPFSKADVHLLSFFLWGWGSDLFRNENHLRRNPLPYCAVLPLQFGAKTKEQIKEQKRSSRFAWASLPKK